MPRILSTAEAMSLPQQAGHRIPYGSHPQQFGELRPPRGTGPAPIAIVIHGGCWSAEYGLGYMGNFCAALNEAGVATWSIEYRRVGNEGGGWPGTFQDVAAAADFVREFAKQYTLDLKRVISVGHSAGGHLALWLAARSKLSRDSELYAQSPIVLRAVVSLAGIPDLARAGREGVCNDMANQLIGGTPAQFPERYRQASPSEILPLGVKQVLIHGDADEHVPLQLSADYEDQARRAGDDVELITVSGAGHFEVVTPSAAAWKRVEAGILSTL